MAETIRVETRWWRLVFVLGLVLMGCSVEGAAPVAPGEIVAHTTDADADERAASGDALDESGDTESGETEPDDTGAQSTPTTPPATATPQPTSTPDPVVQPVLPLRRPTPVPSPSPTPSPTSTPVPTPTPSLTDFVRVNSATCPPEVTNSRVSCQRVVVPEDDTDPRNGRTVELLVATVDNEDSLGIGPTIYLQGGPGGGLVHLADRFVDIGFDVILLDQRGTGGSTPVLECPESDALYEDLVEYEARDPEGTSIDFAADRACRERLVLSGVNPAAFNTEQNADDVALLREALGYDEWNLWGSSYGTRLALTVMRDHPEGVRAALLDAVLPLEIDFFGSIPANADRAFQQLADACNAQPDCVERYGDVRALISQAAAALDEEPQVVEVSRPVSGDTLDVLVDGPTFLSFVFDQLYLASVVPRIPLMVDRAVNGDIEELTSRSITRSDPERLVFSEGLYWSVFCQDDYTFHDPALSAPVFERTADAFDAAFDYSSVDERCDIWSVQPSPAIEDQPVVSDIPTLLFGGQFDPITPPDWARQVGASLTNAQVVVFADGAHGVQAPCGRTIARQFLADPATALDTSCAPATAAAFQ